ncbi:hypothetical protein [Microbispora sp. CA-102843]|uniref:hypothetical protein n=1 Tax=Microbispora sp. CA-102843 TaxID=3239952 RepID=UPI003D94D9F5
MSLFIPSTTPGAIIGYTSRGPIRLMAGGSGEGAPAPAAPASDPSQQQAPQGQAPATTPAPTAAPQSTDPASQAPAPPSWTPPPPVPPIPQPPAQAAPPADDGTRDVSRLPQWAQKEIADLRQENANRRVAARTAVVAQHAFAAAPTLGVNGHALLQSLPFQAAAAELDPAAPDFNTQLAAKINEILQANPWMAAQQSAAPTPAPPPASGAPMGTTPPPPRPNSLEAAIAARLGR